MLPLLHPAESESKGTLYPLLPCCAEYYEEVTVGCLLKDVLPGGKNIKLTDGTRAVIGASSSEVKIGSFYTQGTFYTIPSNELGRKNFVCTVADKKQDLRLQCKNLDPVNPSVQLLLSSCDEGPSDVGLICLVSYFRPRSTSVAWLKNGNLLSSSDGGFITVKDRDGTYSGKRELKVSRESWNKLDEYTCQVTHQKQKTLHNISKCTACQGSFMSPVVDLEISSEEIFFKQQGKIRCLVSGNNLDEKQIFLKLNGQRSNRKRTVEKSNDIQKQLAVTYELSYEEWKPVSKVSCVVTLPCSAKEVQKEKQVAHVMPDKPSVDISLPSCDEKNDVKEVSLICLVYNFWADEDSPAWFKKEKKLEHAGAEFRKVASSLAKSVLKVPRADWDSGEEYTCQVSRQNKVDKKTISKCSACHGSFMSPFVTLTKPSIEDLLKGTGKIICSVFGKHLDQGQISLTLGGQPKNNGITLRNNGKKNTLAISYNTTESEWKSADNVTCVVKEPCLGTFEKEEIIDHSDSVPMSPRVEILLTSSDDISKASEIPIVCLVSDFQPGLASVAWLKNGMAHKKDSTFTSLKDMDGTFMGKSILNVTRDSWDAIDVYTCEVTHQNNVFIQNISKPAEFQTPSLQVTTIHPKFENIFLDKVAELKCVVKNVPSADGLQITWYVKQSKVDKPLDTNLDNIDTTFTGVAYVSAKEWAEKTFVCEVKHRDLPSSRKVELKKSNASTSAPSVHVFAPLVEEIATGETATMTCFVKGFYPSDLFVKWLRKGKPIDSHQYINSEPMTEYNTDNKTTYFMYSKLKLEDASDWNNGDSFSCLVGHESLPFQVTQRSIDKSTARLLYSEEEELEDKEGIGSLLVTALTFICLFILSLFYSVSVTVFKVLGH